MEEKSKDAVTPLPFLNPLSSDNPRGSENKAPISPASRSIAKLNLAVIDPISPIRPCAILSLNLIGQVPSKVLVSCEHDIAPHRLLRGWIFDSYEPLALQRRVVVVEMRIKAELPSSDARTLLYNAHLILPAPAGFGLLRYQEVYPAGLIACAL